MFQWMNDHPYTCPLLLTIQGIVKRQSWSYGCDGWRLMESPNVEARCMWPDWLILLECRAWNTHIGLRIRQVCGTEDRERRLKYHAGT